MRFNVISVCPNCGAPIWSEEQTSDQLAPPSIYFSCSCKPEKLIKKHFKDSSQFEVEPAMNDTITRIILND